MPRRAPNREERHLIARSLAKDCDGVVHRADLRRLGVGKAGVRAEVRAGRWFTHGRHTVSLGAGELGPTADLWRAVWESGSGAVLDGAAALRAGGLRGFEPHVIDVSQPRNNRHHLTPGVRLHRRATMPPVCGSGVPRVRAEPAAVHAALWARSDREAALVLCLVVQQRLTTPDRLLAAWCAAHRAGPRRPFLADAVLDICDGVHALGELDFTRLCRRRGLPEPSRQVVRQGSDGRVYLDAGWEDVGLFVEIDGGHHQWALSPVDDALRQNEVVLSGEVVLRIPVLGLRLAQERFLDQVVAAHGRLSLAAS
jgi:very-short-patch-repair endonuclease